MRLSTLILATSVLAFVALPGLATAHNTHTPCGASNTILPTLVLTHVDVWGKGTPCTGVVVSSPAVECTTGIHQHAGGVHVLALNGHGCQTGVIVENPTLPVLP